MTKQQQVGEMMAGSRHLRRLTCTNYRNNFEVIDSYRTIFDRQTLMLLLFADIC